MANIASEFGGAGSHGLNEYYPLAGKGVSGIPASGKISFSHFHGKSNRVTERQWVESGHNETYLAYLGQRYNDNGFYHYLENDTKTYRTYVRSGYTYFGSPTGYWRQRSRYKALTVWTGDYRYTRGSYKTQARDGSKYYYLRVDKNETRWVDTSYEEETTTTVRITT